MYLILVHTYYSGGIREKLEDGTWWGKGIWRDSTNDDVGWANLVCREIEKFVYCNHVPTWP